MNNVVTVFKSRQSNLLGDRRLDKSISVLENASASTDFRGSPTGVHWQVY